MWAYFHDLHLTNAFHDGSNLANGDFKILQTATGRAAQLAGSQFLFQALSEQVKVSDVKTLYYYMTTNLATTGMQIGKQTTYFAKNLCQNR
ncbi:hypothetical protein [Candidatus Hamiltonella endosymbiont of Tuberolachnus salignus]|uniref:hypothetical protein n=1 Tax=Candidatus Williamhamiltonella endosymbiont of Tuberolachnus salignus TaxID=3077954 RepID=UPI0030CBE933